MTVAVRLLQLSLCLAALTVAVPVALAKRAAWAGMRWLLTLNP